MVFESCPSIFNAAEYCVVGPAQRDPEKLALVFVRENYPSQSWSYREVCEAVLRIGQGLQQLGLAPQSRVFIHLPSSPDYAFLFFGAMAAGFVPIPSYEHSEEEEVLFQLRDSESALLVFANEASVPHRMPAACRAISIDRLQASETMQALVKTKADDPALLVYTSGTTGHPKGVLHAHHMAWGRRPIRECLLAISKEDRLLHTDTLNFTYTFGVQLMDTWASGATAILYAGESSAAIWPDLINTHQATIFVSTPGTYFQMLQECPEKLQFPTLRHSICAGDVLDHHIIEAWEKTTSTPLYESLGMTEVNLFISTDSTTPRKKGSLGRPQKGRKVAVLPLEGGITPVQPNEVGCLAVHRSDPGLMLGYWHRPEEEKESFRGEWFLTGDLVHQDEEGYFFVHGRIGTLLKIDSYIVSPAEIEEVMRECPAIEEVGCWAVNGPNNTPVLALFVVAKKENEPSEASILAYAREHLTDYKQPQKVFFLEELPRDARGKLIRRKLHHL